MELKLSAEDAAFRDEVREFIATSLPPDIRHKVEYGLRIGKADYLAWQKILFEKLEITRPVAALLAGRPGAS